LLIVVKEKLSIDKDFRNSIHDGKTRSGEWSGHGRAVQGKTAGPFGAKKSSATTKGGIVPFSLPIHQSRKDRRLQIPGSWTRC
jgi:hypothetical protein